MTPRGDAAAARKSSSKRAGSTAAAKLLPFILPPADVPTDECDDIFFDGPAGSGKDQSSRQEGPWGRLIALLTLELLFLVWLKWALEVYQAVQPLS